jgi:hypothetical protein
MGVCGGRVLVAAVAVAPTFGLALLAVRCRWTDPLLSIALKSESKAGHKIVTAEFG